MPAPDGSPARLQSFGSAHRVQGSRRVSEDDEAEMWAALERLPTYDRLRTTILENLQDSETGRRQVDVKEVDRVQYLTSNVFKLNNPPEDNENFLAKVHDRIEKAGVEKPTVEVRYENLTVRGQVQVGSRALPTLTNTVLDFIDSILAAVKLSPHKRTDLTILDGVTGILKPGRMTLLLGPPSSGKTTLLLALAGQVDPDLKVEGTISYNGYKLDEFVPKKTAAYISQNDLHIPELTVRETMDYSARYQGVGTRYDLIYELLRREKELGIRPDPDVDFYMKATAMEDVSHDLVTEYYMKIMGLDICADTVVGDQMLKGISGGQKKRLTTAEMIVGPTKALFMDEISTGLDSTTTFQVVKCMGQFASLSGDTILMSLLQPAPETYNLFDEVILLSGGQVLYHGPRESVEEFFQTSGFKCPPRKGIADFLQEVTSRKDQEQYWADKNRPYKFVPAKQFAEAYKNFHAGQKMYHEMATPFDKSKSHKASLVFNQWSLPQWDLLKITFKKELLLLRKNYFLSVFILTQLSLMATLIATLFFRTENHRRNLDDGQKYSGALFSVITQAVFTGFGEITFTAIRFPAFIKFRQLQFFPPWTWTLSMFIMKIPLAILEGFAIGAFSYYIVGFAPSAARYFKLLLILMIADHMSSGLFRMLAGFCKTIVLASSVGGFFLLMIFALGGFVIPRTDIRGWWIWAYWVSPLSYLQNGAGVNEYLSPQWRKPLANDNHTLGHRSVLSLGLFDRGYWFWLACGALIMFSIGFNVLFAGAITFLNPPGKTRAVVSEELLAEWRANLTGEAPTVPKKASSLPRSISSGVKSNGSASRGGTVPAIEDSSAGAAENMQLQTSDPNTSSRSSLRRDDSSNPSASGRAPKRGMVLPFQPFCISFSDVNYAVDMPAGYREQGNTEDKLQLLRGITGAFRPGVLTALVGVTGAGKSTLMDVLSGRKTRGYVEGDIRINGFPKNQDTFTRIAAYCEQNDIHSPQITLHESLIFSAWLRLQPEISSQTKVDFVQEVMELVELTPLKDALVGVPGQSGLSTEQRKRLTIAVELVTNPSIIFMDEPTSGLDARAAATVMRAVRNTVDTGRTVVCTIHQPSIDIFESFDELLLLKRGGEAIYAGPLGLQSHKLIEYFQGIASVPDIKDGENPAAWMLDITTPGMEQKLGVDFAELYRKSSAFEQTKDLVERLGTPPPDTQDISFPTKFAQPMWTQFTCCLWKQHWTYWRSPGYNLMRICLSLATALFMGTLFWGLGKKMQAQRNLFSLMGAIFTANSFYGVLTAGAVQPLISSERTVFYRERSAGMYSETPYALAQCLIEIPYVLQSSTVYSLIVYAMIKLEWDAGKFFWYWFFMFASQVTFVYWGMLTVSLTPNAGAGAILAGFMYQLWALYSGFAIPYPKFPVWLKWIYWCNPSAYTIYGVIASQFGDLDNDYVTSQTGVLYTVKGLIQHTYGYKHSFLWFIGSMAAVFPFLFAVGFIICIKVFNFQQR